MISVPFAAPPDFTSSLQPPENPQKSLWFIFSGQKLLIELKESKLPSHNILNIQSSLYMGLLGDTHLFTGQTQDTALSLEGFTWSCLRDLHHSLHESLFALAGRALQLIQWDTMHQFCGRCGALTFLRPHERCRECSQCSHLSYPKIAPAILALVRRDDNVLLATNPNAPGVFYSPLAGFVEPGETLEQCLERELFEEIGIKVKNIRYLASQSWPFSSALMIGFSCEWLEGELSPDPSEIAHAEWFKLSHLPTLPPTLSLSRLLIEELLSQHRVRSCQL